ncbi:DUF4260 domain-containing protein [Bacillus sp. FJAT-45066]|uniref:DUF4260 domain-containing protein n=1 Tax=Bacillus sp. FJAT-45066 TaxID=2011010 RepID=UPI000BB95EE7|nr:DUF4260 domain-containing protein [Bacillus sp. FJAT-45066]
MTKLLLHLEGSFVLLASIYFYAHGSYSWLLFFILLFTPDISMVGYIVNNKIGALSYNLFHTYLVPIMLVIIGVIFKSEILIALSLIWFAHIGMDRMLGYGLKYPTHFKDTHLSRV